MIRLLACASPAAALDMTDPAWLVCYDECIRAIETENPAESAICAGDPAEALCNRIHQVPEGGEAFERFQTCSALCDAS